MHYSVLNDPKILPKESEKVICHVPVNWFVLYNIKVSSNIFSIIWNFLNMAAHV